MKNILFILLAFLSVSFRLHAQNVIKIGIIGLDTSQSTAFTELLNLVRIATIRLYRTHFIFTADLGFLYTYSPLREDDKVDKVAAMKKNYRAAKLDSLVTSEEAGEHRPGSAIIWLAMHKCRCLPEETVMVGDNFTHDIQGALDVGIDGVWLNWTD